MQDEKIDLVLDDAPRRGGVSLAVIVSVILHSLLITYVVLSYHPVTSDSAASHDARLVQLIRQNPKQFTEAPGPSVDSAPLTAPWSDANRRAATPQPTGDKPTSRPGEGGLFTPRSNAAKNEAQPEEGTTESSSRPQPASAPSTSATSPSAPPTNRGSDPTSPTFAYHPPAAGPANGAINWRNAIREVGKVASLGGEQQNLDLGNAAGGEKGYAKDGPISFESQWYDWGPYAESMVSKIRVNWYGNMPQLIQTGLKGVVTIRFTIHRDGRLTDVTILSSSGAPPYDFAAKKAIQLSSPLNPLPPDFPNATEHVTAMFFYNQEPPQR
ncbi:MAG: TonB family protein [Thermoanaerobaculia bacterium]